MTLEDLKPHLLLVGLRHEWWPTQKILHQCADKADFKAMRPLSRYPRVHEYDIGVAVMESGRILVAWDMDPPDHSGWAHWHTYDSVADAWGFVTQFLQEHP